MSVQIDLDEVLFVKREKCYQTIGEAFEDVLYDMASEHDAVAEKLRENGLLDD